MARSAPCRQPRRLRAPATETPSLLGSSHGKAGSALVRHYRRMPRGCANEVGSICEAAFKGRRSRGPGVPRPLSGSRSTLPPRRLRPCPLRLHCRCACRSQRRRLRARPASEMMSPLRGAARPHRCGEISAGGNCGAAAHSTKSLGRELDPRFYCSLRAVKVVSPAFARRSPPLTVLARMRRVSIGSRRRVVAVGRQQAHGFFVRVSRRARAICAFTVSNSSFGTRRPRARSMR